MDGVTLVELDGILYGSPGGRTRLIDLLIGNMSIEMVCKAVHHFFTRDTYLLVLQALPYTKIEDISRLRRLM